MNAHNFLDNIGPVQAWFVGIMAADGCVSDAGQITLVQSGPEGEELLLAVRSIINHDGQLYKRTTSHKPAFALSLRSKSLSNRLADFNVLPRKSLTYTYPLSIPVELDSAFVRGYIEGDGSVGIYNSGTCHYLIISLVGTEEFTNTCNSRVPVSGNRRRIKKAKNSWELRWIGRKALEIGEWLWQDTSLPASRKHRILLRFTQEYHPQYIGVAFRKQKVSELLNQGISPMKAALMTGEHFQTVYKWIKSGL